MIIKLKSCSVNANFVEMVVPVDYRYLSESSIFQTKIFFNSGKSQDVEESYEEVCKLLGIQQ